MSAAARMHDDLQRLPESRRTGPVVGNVVVLAVVLERLLALEDLPHDLDVLARLAQRLPVRLTVPTLGDLRTRRAHAEQEAAAAHPVERGCGHRGHRGRARGHLHDRGAKVHCLGVRHHPCERRDRVGAVRLGRPARVESEGLRTLRERDRLRQAVRPVLVAEVYAESQCHGRIVARSLAAWEVRRLS